MSVGSQINGSTGTLLMEPMNREIELEKEVNQLKSSLDTSNLKKIELEDQVIDLRAKLLIKQQTEEELKQQLKVLSEFAINNGAHQKTVDLQRMYDQMVYKDGRIVELNNIILEKERNIMDLQEMCREQSQVATAKSLAVKIVNKRLRELDSRKFQDVSTQYSPSDSDNHFKKTIQSQSGVENSPGHAVPQLKINGNGSPPPADPVDDLSSYTTETYPDEMDLDREWSGSPSTSRQIRKHRKRVTFDLNAARKANITPEVSKIQQELNNENEDIQSQNLAQAVVDLSNENDQLRRTISEMERQLTKQEGNKIAELEEEAEHARKEGKNQALRARAAAQARIKDLETRLLELKIDSSKKIENLEGTMEVLKSSREWALFENLQLQEQITIGKTKLEDLRGELDSSLNATTYYRNKLEVEERRTENLSIELKDTRLHAQTLSDEREFYQSEIARLKEAIAAQDEFVSLLEGDLIVYEAHVGILRETLGASKKEDRQIIRSKAFNAKLNALELEKKEISKRNNDERIRTKALNVKIRMLEEERDQLIMRLQQYEGGSQRNAGDSLASTDDELMHDTKPTFHEQDALNVGLEESTVSEPAYISGSTFETHKESELYMQQTPTAFPPPSSQSDAQTLIYQSNGDEFPQVFDDHSAHLEDSKEDSFPRVFEDQLGELKDDSFPQVFGSQSPNNSSYHLEREIERLRDQRTEGIAILNHFMGEICEHLRSHSHRDLANQMESDLRTYQMFPDVDLVIVINQVRRFIDEVIGSLFYDVSTLRIEREALGEQFELAQYALNEAESCQREVENVQRQLEANKIRIEVDWQLIKNSLLIQSARDRHQIPYDVEGQFPNKLHDSNDHLENNEQSESRVQLEQEVVRLQTEYTQISNDHTRTLTLLSDIQQQNRELDQQVEKLKIEADLSRRCLEDLRTNSTLMMEERDDMERKIVHLQGDNQRISSENSHLLVSLNTAQQQNVQLDQLVAILRADLDRTRIESELSRNCLEDLRNNTNWQRQNQPIPVVRPEPQQPNQQQQAILQNRLPLQQTPASAFMPVERAVENTAREALQQRANDPLAATLEQQGPSRLQSIELPTEVNEVEILGDITRASQRVANFLQSQSERLTNSSQDSIRQSVERTSAEAQTENSILQHSLTQTKQQHFEEAQSRILMLEEAVGQKDMAINTLIGERDHLNQLYGELRMAYETLQNEFEGVRESLSDKEKEQAIFAQQRNIESEGFRASIVELQQNIDQLISERNSIQRQLAEQKSYFENELFSRESTLHANQQFANTQENDQLQGEINSLRHQIVQLSAESRYNAQMANERDYFRQQFEELQSRHENEVESVRREVNREEELKVQSGMLNVNVDFSQQFDNSQPTLEESTQTETIQVLDSLDTIPQPPSFVELSLQHNESLPQFNATAMTRVVQEQKAILRACIEESVQMESYMSTGVEHLMSLNSELETCAESIKAQVYALNQQIAQELSEQTQQITQNLELSRLASSDQVEELRTELVSTRAENELNLQRIGEVQATHQTLQRTYDELIERYTNLQESFEDLQTASTLRASMEEKSTDALLDGSTIDRICDLNATIQEMSVASSEARNQLNEYQQRLQSLQSLMSTQLNSTHDKLKELKSDEFVALKSSVVASISEFKMYLLHSFGQLQQALETTQLGESSSMTRPDEMRRELENTERVSRALVLCEKICRDIEEDSQIVNEQANSSACLETMLNKIHAHWRSKQEELAEKVRALNEQRHLSEALEGRLNEAEAQLNLIQSHSVDPNADSTSLLSANIHGDSVNQSNLHLAILAARLTTKQADNDALFRCNSELAKTNVNLHTQVEHLQDCVKHISDELNSVTSSISSNSRHSSLSSLNNKQSEEHPSPASLRRRVESEELPAVHEDLTEPIEATITTSLNNNVNNENSTEISVKSNNSTVLVSTVTVIKKKSKSPAKEIKKEESPIDEKKPVKKQESPIDEKKPVKKAKLAAKKLKTEVSIEKKEEIEQEPIRKPESPPKQEVVEKPIASPVIQPSTNEDDQEDAWAWSDEEKPSSPIESNASNKQSTVTTSKVDEPAKNSSNKQSTVKTSKVDEPAKNEDWGWNDQGVDDEPNQNESEDWGWNEEENFENEDSVEKEDNEDNWTW